jgi:hypothetical protein
MPDHFLQPPYLLRQRRLCHMQPLRRSSKMQFLSHRQEIAKVSQLYLLIHMQKVLIRTNKILDVSILSCLHEEKGREHGSPTATANQHPPRIAVERRRGH